MMEYPAPALRLALPALCFLSKKKAGGLSGILLQIEQLSLLT